MNIKKTGAFTKIYITYTLIVILYQNYNFIRGELIGIILILQSISIYSKFIGILLMKKTYYYVGIIFSVLSTGYFAIMLLFISYTAAGSGELSKIADNDAKAFKTAIIITIIEIVLSLFMGNTPTKQKNS